MSFPHVIVRTYNVMDDQKRHITQVDAFSACAAFDYALECGFIQPPALDTEATYYVEQMERHGKHVITLRG